MKKILCSFLLFACISQAMDRADAGAAAGAASGVVEVDATFVRGLIENGFDAFIATKKGQRDSLKTVKSIPFLGRVASGLLEAVGAIEDTDHAVTFLDRMFADEESLQGAIRELESDPDNLAYLQAVFAQITDTTVTKEQVVAAMRAVRHAKVPEPNLMGAQDTDGRYTLRDADFHPWAVCNFLVFHWHERQQKAQQTQRKPRGIKKRGSSGSVTRK